MGRGGSTLTMAAQDGRWMGRGRLIGNRERLGDINFLVRDRKLFVVVAGEVGQWLGDVAGRRGLGRLEVLR